MACALKLGKGAREKEETPAMLRFSKSSADVGTCVSLPRSLGGILLFGWSGCKRSGASDIRKKETQRGFRSVGGETRQTANPTPLISGSETNRNPFLGGESHDINCNRILSLSIAITATGSSLSLSVWKMN